MARLNITPKVDKTISNATYSFILKKEDWFIEVETSIQYTLNKYPRMKEMLVKFWLGRCDALRAEKVREMIVTRFVEH